MLVHSATCSCSIELYKLSYTLADFFAKLGHFAGFSLLIIDFPVRISEAAMGGVGDIIIHNLGAQLKDTPSYCDFSPVFFYILFAVRISEAAMGGGSGDIILNSLGRKLVLCIEYQSFCVVV
jgi:hypothetical protein